MRVRTIGTTISAVLLVASLAVAQTEPAKVVAAAPQASPPAATTGLQIKYVRDSAEYATLAQQTFRLVRAAIERALPPKDKRGVWCAVLDIDETVLDNSVYQLERDAYGLPYERGSWAAWVARKRAEAVPGATEFALWVHGECGRIAYISNRLDETREATIANLQEQRLWGRDDLLCLDSDSSSYPKSTRRKELRAGTGACSWPGVVPNVVVYLGDQTGDFPAKDEEAAANDPAAFGTRYFLLPNPMYGGWTKAVTRVH